MGFTSYGGFGDPSLEDLQRKVGGAEGEEQIDDETSARLASASEAARNGGVVCFDCRGARQIAGTKCRVCDGRGWHKP